MALSSQFMNLEGKVALVTGSTTGIGEACARALSEAGAAVMVSGRNKERGLAVVDNLRAGGGVTEFWQGDLRETDSCETLVAETISRLGGTRYSRKQCRNSLYRQCPADHKRTVP